MSHFSHKTPVFWTKLQKLGEDLEERIAVKDVSEIVLDSLA